MFQQFVAPVPLKRPVITAEPSIRMRKLKPHDRFLIFASDGLWEQLSDEAAVEIVFKNPRAVSSFPVATNYPRFCHLPEILKIVQGIAKRLVRAALTKAAKKREMRYNDIKKIERGIRRHFHDDITVIVIYLDQHCQGKPSRSDGSSYGYTSAPVDIFSFNSDESSEAPLCPEK